MTTVQTPPSSPPPPSSRPRSRKLLWVGIGALVVVVAAAVAIWYFVFRDTAPPPVNIDSAGNTAQEERQSSSGDGDQAASSLDGTWTVDGSIGEFNPDADVYTSAFVGYRVNEELASIGAKTAFGRTPDVTGTITIDGTEATEATFTADLTGLQSDDDRRDGQLANQGIQTAQFPTATFTLTEPIDFGEVPTDETVVSVQATGDLTLHGVTKNVTIPLQAKLVGDTIVVTGIYDITFADFGIERPVSAAVLTIEDRGQMEFQLFFTKD